MLGSPPRSERVPDSLREMPSPAEHSKESLAAASDERVQEAITLYMGFGRKIPPELIDPGLALHLRELVETVAPRLLASIYRAHPKDRYRRALLRATYHNLCRMRANGGLPWEA